MKTIEKPVNLLKPYSKNQKKHDQNQINNVAESIKQFGFVQPLVIDRNNVVVIGHCRLLAAKKLKMDTVPCVIVDDLTEEQVRKLRIVDNKSNESPWDMGFLLDDLAEIDFSDFNFDFPELSEYASPESDISEYDRRMQEFKGRMEAGELSEDDEEYQNFVNKFTHIKNTDDCYTPPCVYDAVANYVENNYGLDKNNFVRPFVPNGDYQSEKYKKDDVVVDNPPFSILAEIVKWYNKENIKYFLFAPSLTVMTYAPYACVIATDLSITYDNGAVVNTSFVTNIDECACKSDPELYNSIQLAMNKEQKKERNKLEYPDNVLTGMMLAKFSKYGVDYSLKRSECEYVRSLDEQKEQDGGIFGGGYLISNAKKQEKIIAKEKIENAKNKPIKLQLSLREQKIVNELH